MLVIALVLLRGLTVGNYFVRVWTERNSLLAL